MTDGQRWEDHALAHLTAAGLVLERRNHRCRLGEIDLVMREGETLVAVEVRYRRGTSHGGAAASVTLAKQRRLALAMRHYLMGWRGPLPPVRFDVVALSGPAERLSVEWLRGAFDAPGGS